MTKTESQKRKEAAEAMRESVRRVWPVTDACHLVVNLTQGQYKTILRALEGKKR